MQISPSILSADFANLQAELAAIRSADWAHVDVMDNHFVPNLTLGLPVVESLRKVSPVPLDCHLMIDDPDRWAPGYAEAGAESVTFHVEAAADPRGLARTLRGLGARAGMAIKPRTPWEPLRGPVARPRHGPRDDRRTRVRRPVVHGDQMPKVRAVRESVKRFGGEVWIQVDGGVSAATIEQCAEAGADVFVAGSAVYGKDDVPGAIAELRALVAAHAHP